MSASIQPHGLTPLTAEITLMEVDDQTAPLEGYLQALRGNDVKQLLSELKELYQSTSLLPQQTDFHGIILELQESALPLYYRCIAAQTFRRVIWRILSDHNKILIDENQSALLHSLELQLESGDEKSLTAELLWIRTLLLHENPLENSPHNLLYLYILCLDEIPQLNLSLPNFCDLKELRDLETLMSNISLSFFPENLTSTAHFGNQTTTIPVYVEVETKVQDTVHDRPGINWIAEFEQIRSLLPNSLSLALHLMVFYQLQKQGSSNNRQMAVIYGTEILNKDPNQLAANYTLARCYYLGGAGVQANKEKAVKHASEVLKKNPNQMTANEILARYYFSGKGGLQHDKEKAFEHANIAFTQNQNRLTVNEILAWCYCFGHNSIQRDMKKARKHANRIIAIKPNHLTANEILARCYHFGGEGVQKNRKKAIIHANRAFAQNSKSLIAKLVRLKN